jgi:uncharacterized protein (TIGR03437 family)
VGWFVSSVGIQVFQVWSRIYGPMLLFFTARFYNEFPMVLANSPIIRNGGIDRSFRKLDCRLLTLLVLLFCLFGTPPGLRGQAPLIYSRAVVNAASFFPSGLPSGPIARGGIFTVFGSGLGPVAGVQVSSFPLQTTFHNVAVAVSQGAATVNAIPLYVSADQLNVLMPSNAPLGAVSLRVTYNNIPSNPVPVQVTNSALGLFAVAGGAGPGVVQNYISQANQPVNSFQTIATSGQTVIAYGTGLGPITAPDNIAPPAGNLPTPVQVFVGGVEASVQYSGRSPCCSGLDQVVFQIPAGVASGCWVPVYMTAGGITTNVVTVAIGANGQNCSEPANSLAQRFIQGGKIGTVRLFRSSTREDIGTASPLEVANDFIVSDFAETPGGASAYASLFSQPPPGTCTVIAGSGDNLATGVHSSVNPPLRLNGGPSFSLTGPNGTGQPASVSDLWPAAPLGSDAPFLPGLPSQLFLAPGSYTLSTTGGPDVGPFKVSLTLPPAFIWTGRDQLNSVDRTQPLALSWSGLPQGQSMAILGGNVDLPSNSSALFYCLAPRDATTFIIPSAILSAIPISEANVLLSKGVVYLHSMTLTNGTSFSAPGLDAALAISGYIIGKTVIFY